MALAPLRPPVGDATPAPALGRREVLTSSARAKTQASARPHPHSARNTLREAGVLSWSADAGARRMGEGLDECCARTPKKRADGHRGSRTQRAELLKPERHSPPRPEAKLLATLFGSPARLSLSWEMAPGFRIGLWSRSVTGLISAVLIANERRDRVALVPPIVVSLGHEVIARGTGVGDVASARYLERTSRQ